MPWAGRVQTFVFGPHTAFDHIVIHHHDEHLHQTYKPPGAAAPLGFFLYQRATPNTITTSNKLLISRASVTLVMEISNGRTSCPAASCSTILPSYLLPAGAMEESFVSTSVLYQFRKERHASPLYCYTLWQGSGMRTSVSPGCDVPLVWIAYVTENNLFHINRFTLVFVGRHCRRYAQKQQENNYIMQSSHFFFFYGCTQKPGRTSFQIPDSPNKNNE